MDDADATFFGQRDGKPALGDRVHGGRDQGNVQADVARNPGLEVCIARQEVRVRGDEQNVVKGKGFLDEPHGSVRRKDRIIRGCPG